MPKYRNALSFVFIHFLPRTKKKWEKAFIFAQQFVKVETLPVAKKRIYKNGFCSKKANVFIFYILFLFTTILFTIKKK